MLAIKRIAMVVGLMAGLIASGYASYRLVPGEGGGSAPSVENVAAERPPIWLLVLPFANATGDNRQDYLADGLTANVTADLARIRDAYIVALATAMTHRDKPVNLLQIGTELGVRFVLQGSVQRNGNTLRINAQLSDTNTNAPLWSASFDSDESDLFALQDSVTTRIAQTIDPDMPIAKARDSETRKSDPGMADLLLRARALNVKSQSLKNYQDSALLYRRALALEPANVIAMVGLVTTLTQQALNYSHELPPTLADQNFNEAFQYVLKVRAIEPKNPDIFRTALVFAMVQNDYGEAKRVAETWVALEPKNPQPYITLSAVLLTTFEPQKVIDVLNRALKLSPTRPADSIYFGLGRAHFMLGDNTTALVYFKLVAEHDPACTWVLPYMAMVYANLGDAAKAQELSAEVKRVTPNDTLAAWLEAEKQNVPAYRQWFTKELVPAWRKAGLPE